MLKAVTPNRVKLKYPATEKLDDFTVQLFIDDSYAHHNVKSFRSQSDFDTAVELYTMVSLLSASPEIAQQYNKSHERIRSEEGTSKEEYEVRYTNDSRQSATSLFLELYERHIRRCIISTRSYL